MHFERPLDVREPSNRARQAMAQALLKQESVPVTHEFRTLPPDLAFASYRDMPHDELGVVFNDVLYNYTHAQARNAAITSAALAEGLAVGSQAMSRHIRGEADLPLADGFYCESHPHPPGINMFIKDFTGFGLATLKRTRETYPRYQQTHMQRVFLGEVLRRLDSEAETRGLHRKPIPPRLHTLRRIDPSDTVFEPEEINSFLHGESLLSDADIKERTATYERVQHDSIVSIEHNARILMSIVFPASHAIETKYPSISPFDATRLLLRNADVIGSESWLRLQDSLFHYTNPLAYGENVNSFSILVDAVNRTPMVLDDNDRLHNSFTPSSSRGLCPLASSYTVDGSLRSRVQEFNTLVEEKYDVGLPVPPGKMVLSTQFVLLGVLTGQELLNGRSYEHIRTYQAMKLGTSSVQNTINIDEGL